MNRLLPSFMIIYNTSLFCSHIFKRKKKISAQETITAPVLEKLFYAMYDAIDNLNSDTMESTLEEMTHFIYPDNQQEFLNQLKTAVSDIDVEQCTKILDAWKSVV